jgi:hypothetical protein
LLTMLAGLTACGEKTAPTETATDLAGITLVPYVSVVLLTVPILIECIRWR